MTDRAIEMRGFTCAVALGSPADPHPRPGAAGIAVGIDDNGADRSFALTLRHADGTILTGFLSEALLDRLALRFAELVHGEGEPVGPSLLH